MKDIFKYRETLYVIPCVMLAIASLILVAMMDNQARTTAMETAEGQSFAALQQFKLLRGYYTGEVVSKVKTGKVDTIAIEHGAPNEIPLPATMIHELSERYEKEGVETSLKLYSDFPFPNRGDRELDPFAKRALAALGDGSLDQYVEFDHETERLRVAIPDKMQNEGCVSCHNSRADTPKDDWVVGDVRGVLEVSRPVANDGGLASLRIMAVMVGLCFALTLSAFGFLLAHQKRRTKEVIHLVRRASQGDFSALDGRTIPGDLIGEVEREIAALFKAQKDVLDRLEGMADAVSNGEFSHRIDPTEHKGSFKDVVSGSNRMMNQMWELIRYCAGAKRHRSM